MFKIFPGPFELSDTFVQYVLSQVICGRCLEKIGNCDHLMLCEKPALSDSFWSSRQNRFCYVPSIWTTEFKKLWQREKGRLRGLKRKSTLSKTPFPPEEILLQLKDKQGNRCYYCFNEFKSRPSNLKPHLDHFVSVANGGSNSIFNLVYACARCNQTKFSENGEEFQNTSSIPMNQRLAMIEGLLEDHYRTVPKMDSSEYGEWSYEALKLIRRKQRIQRDSGETPINPLKDLGRSISKMRESVDEWKAQFRPKDLKRVEGLLEEHLRSMPDTRTGEFNEWVAEDYRLRLRLECIRGECSRL